jgi:ferredoxin, 2Fe-2S
MVRITFVEASGTERAVEVEAGTCLMRAAINNDVQGMMADCGGELSCATCHAYLDPAFVGKAGEPSEEEREMLECAVSEIRPNSRLACQVVLTDALDGMRVELPERQI